ncbi:UNKNOWN [Stylonychia lemnae]|uniref:Cytochrome b5 heme-binding domain-containing protein n=1 Tax=Stylonychia lemnae TaxID=5949 RepID=A0A078A696_STYLE|nr:UNKNOWN [Stylonychia lemnae]|eukprot:CDW77376.1 UNKNOWN [Stylonychia lemnae]
MILAQARGNESTAYDLWSTRHGRPSTDDVQNIVYGFITNDTHVVFQIDRDLDTGDSAQDFNVIVGEPMNMINSCNVNTANLQKHTSKGPFTMFLNYPEPNNSANTPASIGNLTEGNITNVIFGADYDEGAFFRIHGWILWLTWGPLAMIQLTTTRYLKAMSYGIQIHMITGILNLVCTLSLGILAAKENQWVIGEHPHAKIGYTIIASIVFICLTGVIMRLRIFKRVRIYQIHKIFGYTFLVFAQIQIVLGVLKYSQYFLDRPSPLGYIHIAFFGFLWIAFETYHQLHLRSKKSELKKKSKVISLYQFNQLVSLGRQLVILDDKIIDVESFLDNHPGGKNVLKWNVGRDISKFFYGSFQFTNMNNLEQKNTHSSLGWQLANQMAIGRLENNYSEEYPVELIYTSQQIAKNTKTFVFQGKELKPGLQNYYSNIGYFGKHFLVFNKKKPDQKRLYYICNCLTPKIYEQYIRLIRSYLESQSRLDCSSNRVALTVTAQSNKQGLSNIIHKRTIGDKYIIRGPLGKGLELQYQGMHLVYTDQIGFIGFLDLIAHLIRKNLGLLDKEESKQLSFVEFKIHLVVCVAKKKSLPGLELCNGLMRINQQMKKDNFSIRLKQVKDLKNFWTSEKIQNELSQFKDIQRIFISGPSKMCKSFDEVLTKMVQKGTLQKGNYEIL